MADDEDDCSEQIERLAAQRARIAEQLRAAAEDSGPRQDRSAMSRPVLRRPGYRRRPPRQKGTR